MNRTGAPALAELSPLAGLTADQVLERQRGGAVILDTRPAMQFGAGHIPGAVNIPLGGQYASSAATLLGLDKEIVLVAEEEAALEESRMRLARVGMEHVVGSLKGGMAQWAAEQKPAAQIAQIAAEELNRELAASPDSIQVVDVRRKPEWEQGHIGGALHKPLDRLESMLGDLKRDRPIVVHCKGGYRSGIACSLIQRAGFENVTNLIGGLDAWQACRLPVVA